MRLRPILIGSFAAAFMAAAAVSAQDDEAGSASGMSRQMKQAVTFYEQGEDIEAMDQFMDILTKGNSSERAVANEYLNLISHRMTTPTKDEKKPAGLKAAALKAIGVSDERPAEAPAAAASKVNEDADERPAEAPAERQPVQPDAEADVEPAAGPKAQANKEALHKEIKSKLRVILGAGLRELKAASGIRVVSLENGDLQAIGIPSARLFVSGISFRKSAGKMLDALTRIVYSLGGAQVTILPEGTAVGDAKVLDMRRTMGISAHLFSAGIATPRLKINLLNTQVEIPKALRDFKGIIVLFEYNRPLTLTVDSLIGDEAGPPITLGVYPQAISPDRDEGAIIEFSVSEPPAGLTSWKFQLLQPSSGNSALAPLQEVVGGGPIFHQIFWNGRRNHFGPVLPPGRYECVVTATDGKGRTRTLHRWIHLLSQGQTAATAEKLMDENTRPGIAAAASSSGRAPSADLPHSAPIKAAALLKNTRARALGVQIVPRARREQNKLGRSARRPLSGKARGRRAKAAQSKAGPSAAPRAEVAPSPAAQSGSDAGLYNIAFQENSHQMTPGGEEYLKKCSELAASRPLENISLTGYARASETDASVLAERRAQMIAGLLINRYQTEPKRIQVRSAVSDERGQTVEIRLSGGAER